MGKVCKQKCPQEGCSVYVLNMRRHLQQVHNLSEVEAKTVSSTLRSQRRISKFCTSGRPYKECPISQCGQRVKRLDQHLVKAHSIKKGTACYNIILRKVKKDTIQAGIQKRRKQKPTLTTSHTCISHTPTPTRPHTSTRNTEQTPTRPHTSTQNTEQTPTRPHTSTRNTEQTPTRPHTSTRNTEQTPTTSHTHTTIQNTAKLSTRRQQHTDEFKLKELNDFKEHLMGRFGGRKTHRAAQQYKDQVLRVVDSINGHLTCLNMAELLEIKFRNMLSEGFAPSTLKIYIFSVKLFYNFCKTQNRTYIKDPEKMIEIMQNLYQSLKHQIQQHKAENYAKEFISPLEPHELGRFESSPIASSALRIIANNMDSKEPGLTQKDYHTVRDYLITQCLLDNAQRSGAIRSITIGAYKKAKTDKEGNKVAIVRTHKRATSSRAVNLVFMGRLARLVDIFVHKIMPRSGANNNVNAPLFQTSCGNELASSHFAKIVKGVSKKRLTATRIRKATVCMVMEKEPTSVPALARHMNLAPRTLQKYYSIYQRTRESLDSTKMITHPRDEHQKKKTLETTCIVKTESDSDIITTNEQMTRNEDSILDKICCEKNTNVEESNNDSPPIRSHHGRRAFSTLQVDLIRNLFKTNIESGQISIHDIRHKFSLQEFHQQMAGLSHKQIYDRIRCFIRNKKRMKKK